MNGFNLATKIKQNLIINPSFDFWQRGQTFNPIANGTYCADRYLISDTLATGALRIDRSTDVPVGALASYSLRAKVTTAQGVVAAGEYSGIVQRVEGYSLRHIRAKSAVLAFWVKAPIAGEYSAVFSNGAQDRSLVKKYTVNQANTWEKKVIRLKHDDSGTWDYNNGIGLYVWFMLAAGSTLATASEDWQNGLKLGSDGQENFFGTIDNEFYITEIQLHEGLDALPYQETLRNFSDELALCQRYFEKSYNLETDLGTATFAGASLAMSTGWSSGNEYQFSIAFKVLKREVPVPRVYNPNSGTIDSIYDLRFGTSRAVGSYLYVGYSSFGFINGAGVATHSGHAVQWVADAEL